MRDFLTIIEISQKNMKQEEEAVKNSRKSDKRRYIILWKGFKILILVAALTLGCMGHMENRSVPKVNCPQLYAWWGTLYPEFCFEKSGDTDESKPVKLSFWLAKALDW